MVALETKLCCRLTEIFESRLEKKACSVDEVGWTQ